MDPQLRKPFKLGDIDDVEAYVRAIVANLSARDHDERQELIADGLELVTETHKTLGPGQSLRAAVSGWLAWRLRDRWRSRHREWRRDPRAATAYALPVATVLTDEYNAERTARTGPDEQSVISSRLSLALFTSEADLRNPRLIGSFQGVPSYAALPTGVAREIWATITAERQLATETVASTPRY